MIERSPAYDSMRKLLALLCIALVVFTTIAPVASSHFSEVLAPLWVVLFPVLTLIVVRRVAERDNEQLLALVSALPPRAPPIPFVLA